MLACKLLTIKTVAKPFHGSLSCCAYCGLIFELSNIGNPFSSQEYALHQCCRWWMAGSSQLCSFLIFSWAFPLLSTDWCSPLEWMTVEGFSWLNIRERYWKFKPNICETQDLFYSVVAGVSLLCYICIKAISWSNILAKSLSVSSLAPLSSSDNYFSSNIIYFSFLKAL